MDPIILAKMGLRRLPGMTYGRERWQDFVWETNPGRGNVENKHQKEYR